MKSRFILHPVSASRPIRAFSLLLNALGFVLLVPGVRAQGVDIGVRSKIMDRDIQWAHKSDAPDQGGHSKSFAILAIDEVKAEESLVKPVDQNAMLGHLIHQLQANGFHAYAKGTKPDILLTVSYGRGDMRNPYERDVGEIPNQVGVPTQTILGAFPEQLYDKMIPGHETNLQKSTFEKLFIRVTAFEYPKDGKTKPKMLWKTIIVADDPANRDLNAVAEQMLEAGAPYFDKDIKHGEVEFYKPTPDGKVNVGTPEVVPPKPKST
jgi:hypothetical protein